MLVRVFEIPPPSGHFHFGGGERQVFVEVDWFHDDPQPGIEVPSFDTVEGREMVTDFIKHKRYFDPAKAYLVLHPEHPFTIGYAAP
jgi:hypothetical protein